MKSPADIINCVWLSSRKMPAHFTNNGERIKSFCVDFQDMSEEAEYSMASSAWYKLNDYIQDNLSDLQIPAIVKIGEDLMIGSFITKRVNKSGWMNEVTSGLINMNKDGFGHDKEFNISWLIKTKTAVDYFNYCIETGESEAVSK